MSTKRTIRQFTLLPTQAADSGFTSPITNITYLDNVGIQVDLTGTLNGSVAVQVSANHVQDLMSPANVTTPGTWATLISQPITGSAPTPVYFDLNQLSAPYIRVVFTATSGSGSATVVITGKTL